MKLSAKSQFYVRFLVIGLVIAIIYIVVLSCMRGGCSAKKDGGSQTEKTQTAETRPEGTAKPPVEQNVAPQPVTPPGKAALRVVSADPAFGQNFDFSKARHGDFSEKEVPGSRLIQTGIVVDLDKRRVLGEKDSSRPVPIASMVKMMTMLLTVEEIDRNPNLSLDTPVTITGCVKKVARTGLVYLSPGEVFSLRELLLCTVVKSANDAATQLADTAAGSVEAFVGRMNRRAKEIGLRHFNAYNPCGLSYMGKNATSSAADLVRLGEYLLEYPVLLEMCSTKSGSIQHKHEKKPTIFVNSNKLINPHYPGVDGLKTGFINKSGFCVTFSALRNGRRIIGCVTGAKAARDRDRFCRKLIDWSYRKISADGGKLK